MFNENLSLPDLSLGANKIGDLKYYFVISFLELTTSMYPQGIILIKDSIEEVIIAGNTAHISIVDCNRRGNKNEKNFIGVTVSLFTGDNSAKSFSSTLSSEKQSVCLMCSPGVKLAGIMKQNIILIVGQRLSGVLLLLNILLCHKTL